MLSLVGFSTVSPSPSLANRGRKKRLNWAFLLPRREKRNEGKEKKRWRESRERRKVEGGGGKRRKEERKIKRWK